MTYQEPAWCLVEPDDHFRVVYESDDPPNYCSHYGPCGGCDGCAEAQGGGDRRPKRAWTTWRVRYCTHCAAGRYLQDREGVFRCERCGERKSGELAWPPEGHGLAWDDRRSGPIGHRTLSPHRLVGLMVPEVDVVYEEAAQP